MTETDSIVELLRQAYASEDDAPVSTAPRTACAHRLVMLDEDSHRVYCRECKAEVDPFAFLQSLCREWEPWERFRVNARRRAQEAQMRLDEILRLERNARARLKKIDPEAAKQAPKKPWGDR